MKCSFIQKAGHRVARWARKRRFITRRRRVGAGDQPGDVAVDDSAIRKRAKELVAGEPLRNLRAC